MQVAAEIRRGYAKNPNSVKLSDMKLKMDSPKIPITREEAAAKSKATWFGRLGIKKKDN